MLTITAQRSETRGGDGIFAIAFDVDNNIAIPTCAIDLLAHRKLWGALRFPVDFVEAVRWIGTPSAESDVAFSCGISHKDIDGILARVTVIPSMECFGLFSVMVTSGDDRDLWTHSLHEGLISTVVRTVVSNLIDVNVEKAIRFILVEEIIDFRLGRVAPFVVLPLGVSGGKERKTHRIRLEQRLSRCFGRHSCGSWQGCGFLDRPERDQSNHLTSLRYRFWECRHWRH